MASAESSVYLQIGGAERTTRVRYALEKGGAVVLRVVDSDASLVFPPNGGVRLRREGVAGDAPFAGQVGFGELNIGGDASAADARAFTEAVRMDAEMPGGGTAVLSTDGGQTLVTDDGRRLATDTPVARRVEPVHGAPSRVPKMPSEPEPVVAAAAAVVEYVRPKSTMQSSAEDDSKFVASLPASVFTRRRR